MSWEGVSIACRKPEKRKIGVTWDYVAFVSALVLCSTPPLSQYCFSMAGTCKGKGHAKPAPALIEHLTRIIKPFCWILDESAIIV